MLKLMGIMLLSFFGANVNAQWSSDSTTIWTTDTTKNVGIGMTSTNHKLGLTGSLFLKGDGSSSYRIRLEAGTSSEHNQIVSFDQNGDIKWKLNMLDRNNGSRFGIYSTTAQLYALTISPSGNVGIKTSPSATYELNVCGQIRAKEVRVQSGWCDYVFNEDYNLLSLEEVKEFIAKNKHLPDVTPGTKIESEGLDVGITSSQMIRKIEELTLYMIEMNDKMKEKDIQINELERQIELLKAKN